MLLVEPPMPDRSNGKSQTKCSTWSFRLGVELGAYDATIRKCIVTKPRRSPRSIQGCSASREEKVTE
jgi:hypothetical protein